MTVRDSNATAIDQASLAQAVARSHALLVDELERQAVEAGGPWRGNLSTSALSTATAVSALSLVLRDAESPSVDDRGDLPSLIEGGCRWLVEHQNPDGGFGDTDRSHSNIATTLLVIAAWRLASWLSDDDPKVRRAKDYVEQAGSWHGLRARYGRDKTFVVPILANCALAGLRRWDQVPALPFEAAWLPQSWYRLARLPVVSYAVPALVAIGQARHFFAPSRNPLIRGLRSRAIEPTLRVLTRMQPDSGGYLEAVPLTSFVLMSLAAMGRKDLPVAQNALRFLSESVLDDGSWPIDTDLATWVTSLSVAALQRKTGLVKIAGCEEHRPTSNTAADRPTSAMLHDAKPISPPEPPGVPAGSTQEREPGEGVDLGSLSADPPSIDLRTVRWLLTCQHRYRHAFTGADPGGWGWTDLSGAVPDADDTPAALLALSYLDPSQVQSGPLGNDIARAVAAGLRWLIGLQNRDGGWPTFCRGWGKLPFDRSGTDLTAHAIRASVAWQARLDWLNERSPGRNGPPSRNRLERSVQRGFVFLKRNQQSDGSWLPLWFGNQDRSDESNPVYGTSKVLMAYAEANRVGEVSARRGIEFLRGAQNIDGGWGGGPSTSYRVPAGESSETSGGHCDSSIGSTIEETAVAIEALLATGADPSSDPAIMRGLGWLTGAIQAGYYNQAWPIGFYFAKLWYYERLYPIVFSVAALGRAWRRLIGTEASNQG